MLQWVASVDIFPNEEADANVVLTPTDSWTDQEKEVSFKRFRCTHDFSVLLMIYHVMLDMQLDTQTCMAFSLC